jgi:hypothetical protein
MNYYRICETELTKAELEEYFRYLLLKKIRNLIFLICLCVVMLLVLLELLLITVLCRF